MSPLDSQDIDRIAARVNDSRPPAQTGEQPMQIISERKTAFSWGVLVALIGVAAMGAVGLARAQDAGVATARNTEDVQTLKVDAAENKSDHKAFRDLLERMDKKLDRLEVKLDAKK